MSTLTTRVVFFSLLAGVLYGAGGLFSTANAFSFDQGPFILEGGGFFMSEVEISESNLEILLKSSSALGDRVVLSVVDGDVSLGKSDIALDPKKLSVISIRDGKFLRISGSTVTVGGQDVTIDLFGKLVQQTKAGSVYSFLGSVSLDQSERTKIVFTTRLTQVNEISGHTQPQEQKEQTSTKPEEKKKKEVKVTILPGASEPGSVKYFSVDPVVITPGTTVTWINKDSVPHTLVSGVKSFSPGKLNKPDGKMNTGPIAPGQSYSTKIEESGIIRFFEPKSYWLDGTIVSLPETESKQIRDRSSRVEGQGFTYD